MIPAVETTGLSRRYGQTWALRECCLRVPAGRVVALVGPNGAGKTTLMQLVMGLLEPSAGEVKVFGWSPRQSPTLVLARVGFVAQDRPLYGEFTVRQMLGFGSRLNPRWDDGFARSRIDLFEIPADRKVSKLSGGQQAQVALTMALAKRPELLLLDEPVSNLDPLARRDFTRALLDAAAQDGLTVVFSSHVVAELERFCDYLVVLNGGRVQVAGELDALIEEHRIHTMETTTASSLAGDPSVIDVSPGPRVSTVVARKSLALGVGDPEARLPGLEELVLAYMNSRGASNLPLPVLRGASL
jgi:ABC-2 type transport system ATP-binding protein